MIFISYCWWQPEILRPTTTVWMYPLKPCFLTGINYLSLNWWVCQISSNHQNPVSWHPAIPGPWGPWPQKFKQPYFYKVGPTTYFTRIYIYIYGTPPQKKPTFLHFLLVCTVFFAYLGTLFFWHFLMIFEVVFTNVYKRYGSIAADLDSRSKIQDSRKNFLDPRSGSKIQDPRF